jgi:hypothetical protein
MAIRIVLIHGSGSVDDRISRLDEITAFGAEWMELLTYLGLGTVVTKEFNADSVTLNYVGTGTGDGGDQYVGLDRFGRVVDQ